ncbi:endospore germination permease [Paenibacillus hodogayensis]|uniref:Endospore germination permease n=1 Tax=Paenibacillus hodogayensis TaxID=279208 RepID=A0ABV5W795_9BACL
MRKQAFLEVRTFTVLVIFFTIGTSILIAPSGLAAEAKQDGWLGCIIGIALNLLVVLLYVVLAERYPGLSLVQYCEAVLGRWLGKAAGLLFVAFFYLLASLMIGDLGFFLASQIMPETPMEVVQILFIIVVGLAVRAGLAVYSRAAEIFFPWLLLLLAVLIVPLVPKLQLHNVTPVLEYGIKPVLKSGFSLFGLQETVVMLMIYPLVSKGKGRIRGLVLGTAIGGFVLFIITLWSIAVLGASLSANQLFPAYTLAKNINIGHFLERVEGVMIFIWILSIFVKIAITFHSVALGTAQLFRVSDEKPFVWPLALGMLAISLICYPNTIYVKDFLAKNWTPFAIVFMVLLPVLLLCMSMIRGHDAKKSNHRHP